MLLNYIVIFAAIGFLLFISYHSVIQLSEKRERDKKRIMDAHYQVVNDLENLLDPVSYVPFSKTLLLCLHGKILTELERMLLTKPSDQGILNRIEMHKVKWNDLKDGKAVIRNIDFKVPDDEKKAISIKKTIKKLEDALRFEYYKGNIPMDDYNKEKRRLNKFNIQINYNLAIKRMKEDMKYGRIGNAMLTLQKTLSMLEHETDSFSESSREKLLKIQDQLKLKKEEKFPPIAEIMKERESEIDLIFVD